MWAAAVHALKVRREKRTRLTPPAAGEVCERLLHLSCGGGAAVRCGKPKSVHVVGTVVRCGKPKSVHVMGAVVRCGKPKSVHVMGTVVRCGKPKSVHVMGTVVSVGSPRVYVCK